LPPLDIKSALIIQHQYVIALQAPAAAYSKYTWIESSLERDVPYAYRPSALDARASLVYATAIANMNAKQQS